MSTEDDEARAVRRLLAPLKARPGTLSPERQAAVWQRIEAQRARRIPRWPLWALAGAATAAALWLGMQPSLPLPPEPLTVAHAPTPAERRISHEINEIAGVRALPSGAQVEVAGRLRATRATADETVLFLEMGRITSRVPPLGAGQRFHIETPTALIAVRGTVFSVEHTQDTTEIEVVEGEVQVQPHGERGWRRLSAGRRWTVHPATDRGLEAARSAGDLVQALELEALLVGSTGLERHNALLRIGHALDRHDDAAAVAHWRRLAPDAGPHAEEAAFRHAAALHRLGSLAEARAAAADFRARFPTSARAAETLGW